MNLPAIFQEQFSQSLQGANLILYSSLFLACMLGNMFVIGFFLPAGTVAALGGYFAEKGNANIVLALFSIWLGMMVGYQCDYSIGRFFFVALIERFTHSRFASRFQVEARLARWQIIVEKHGTKAIYYAYATLGHFRSLVAVSIGISRLSYWRFWANQSIASLLWSIIYAAIGYGIGMALGTISGSYQNIGIIAGCIFLSIYIFWALISAMRGEFYDPLFGRFSFKRQKNKGPAET